MRKHALLVLLFCSSFSIFSQERDYIKNLSDYIENLAVFEEGQEPPRAYHIPKEHISLNGEWKFFYSETPEGIPANFYQVDHNDRDWTTIKVPSNWEMLGFGDKQFRNISTTFSITRPENAPQAKNEEKPKRPFTVVPPKVPKEYNPTGAYRMRFVLPAAWEKKEIFLRLEKVASASFLWVNGQQVGYNEGAQEPSEYNITKYLNSGENTIALMVLKFSDGYYLEGQDYWRLAGIFDDVWLLATPKVRLFDWQTITDFDDDYENATLSLNVAVKSYEALAGNYLIKTILKYNGAEVTSIQSKRFTMAASEKKTISLNKEITKPAKWTAHTPHLYQLTIQLLDTKKQVLDELNTKLGFKETEIIGNTFFLNGVPIKLNSINSHMQDPVKGHVMDEATIRKDFEILRQYNFNSVRTSHYPPVNKYLELANEYGIYIIDEAGTEAHASEYMSEMPDYLPMYLDRVRKMVIRDRNHPSVLFWSAGNESGEGENITKIIEEGKRLDPSRYWMYGGNADKHPGEEIIGPRYPTPIELAVYYGMEKEDSRPSFMDEYLSIAGNGGGGLDEFWQVIYKYPRLMGGAIWDFVSPGLQESIRQLEDRSPNKTPVHIMGNAQLKSVNQSRVLDLNGHDQWVEVYRSDSLEINSEQLTLSMQLYPRKLNRSSGALLTKGNYQFGLVQIANETLDFYIYTDRKQVLSAVLPANWENNWHELSAVYDGKTMKIFIDGKEAASKVAQGTITNFPFPINIGRNAEKHGQDTDVYLSDAQFDNVGIFTKALLPKDSLQSETAALWLDFENETKQGTFLSYGIGARTYGAIWPDRTPQPEMLQMKKSAQPLAFSLLDAESGLIEVWNRSNFANANYWHTTWSLTEDNEILQSGTLDLELKPQGKKSFHLPIQKPDIVPGKAYRIDISSTLKKQEIWAPKGYEVSWEQFELSEWFVPNQKARPSSLEVTLEESEEVFQISGADFVYKIDKSKGALSSILIDKEELLNTPLELNVWRAPIANELDGWNGGTISTKRWREGYGGTLATDYYSNGIHDLKQIPLNTRAIKTEGKVIVYVHMLSVTNGVKEELTMTDRYVTGQTLSGFESIYEYHISGDGNVKIKHQINPQGTMPQMLPRIGLSFMLNPDFNQVEWHGRGPQENYPDRKTAYRLGIYQTSVEDMYEPYLIPQDHGLRTDNRWLRLRRADGKGLEFKMDKPFNFNLYPFTTENLTKALYTYQLTKAKGITLNLDYATTGLGGTARPVLESYRVYPKVYKREITIRPLK